MSSSVLIADTSIPFAVSLAGSLRSRDVSVAILSGLSPDSPLDLPWNRPSALSARTVLLDAKNRFGPLDCAVLAFDVSSIPPSYRNGDSSSLARLADEYIRGYLLLASEITAAFRQQKGGLFCFAVINSASSSSSATSGAQPLSSASSRPSAPAQSPASDIACSVAERAFIALAEETAASCAATPSTGIQAILVKLDSADEAANLEWFTSQILNPAASRKENRWVKPGARGLFAKLS